MTVLKLYCMDMCHRIMFYVSQQHVKMCAPILEMYGAVVFELLVVRN